MITDKLVKCFDMYVNLLVKVLRFPSVLLFVISKFEGYYNKMHNASVWGCNVGLGALDHIWVFCTPTGYQHFASEEYFYKEFYYLPSCGACPVKDCYCLVV